MRFTAPFRSAALLPALLTCTAALAASNSDGQVVAVFELRSRVIGPERRTLELAGLAENVRDVAQRTLQEARVLSREELPQPEGECDRDCALRAAREAGADLAVTADLARLEQGFLVSLELRETRSGKLIGTTTATGATPEELGEAITAAAVDLFRPRKGDPAAVSIGPATQPEVPALAAPLQEGGAVNLDVDASVLVAYDEARSAEAQGKDHPDDAAAGWRAVAEAGGENPFREIASTRAKQWQGYAEKKRAFDAQLARDSGRIRKVLPLRSVTDTAKLELLVRYTRAYGAERALALLALLPAGMREHADRAIGCEAKDSIRCIVLARAADEAKDATAALDYLDRACDAGAIGACAEAGDRWLRSETRDVARSTAALQKACAAANAAGCSRLARVYEEGDGAAADRAQAAQLREKACSAGDGPSCRRLASTIDGSTPADQARAAALWQKGCENKDAISCVVARSAAGREARGPAVRRSVDEAKATPSGSTTVRPASFVPRAESTAPAGSTGSEARASSSSVSTLTGPVSATSDSGSATSSSSSRSHGIALLGLAALTGGAALYAIREGDHQDRHDGRRFLVLGGNSPGSGHGTLSLVLGAAALLSATTGVVLIARPHDQPAALSVGLAPGGLVLSGTLP